MAQPAIDLGLGGPGEPLGSPGPLALALEVCEVTHRFGPHTALDGVSLGVGAGEVHAILGPNGAGKTTLLRVLSGLTEPAGGEVWFHVGGDLLPGGWQARRLIGVVGSAERSFYLRLSGLENLIFFGRLHGLRRRAAKTRAHQLLERVGLCAAAGQRVGTYSQGMKQRLAVARAFLSAPPVLLFDEATHDLDPEGAATVRGLAAEAAAGGAAVLWATQRLEEIRGFAQAVTLLHDGRVRFGGTVEQLIARSAGRSYVVRLRDGGREATHLDGVLGEHGRLSPIAGDTEHYRLRLDSEDALGRALARLVANSVDVLACREESSEIEQAFLRLVGAGR